MLAMLVGFPVQSMLGKRQRSPADWLATRNVSLSARSAGALGSRKFRLPPSDPRIRRMVGRREIGTAERAESVYRPPMLEASSSIELMLITRQNQAH